MTLSYPFPAPPSPVARLHEEDSEGEPPSHIVQLQADSKLWKKDMLEQVRRAAEVALDFVARRHQNAETLIVSILCTDEKRMRTLNLQFRNKDSACDSLAFPATAFPNDDDILRGFLGDIALGYQGLQRAIERHHLDALAHCAHMTVHGVLHLTGLLHDGQEERAAMEEKEGAILARLGFVGLHPLTLP